MFVTQKMILLDVLVLQQNIEDVSKLIVESGYFEPSLYSFVASEKKTQWTYENITEKKKMISTLKKSAEDLKIFFSSSSSSYSGVASVDNNIKYTIPTIGDALRQYTLKKNQLEERYHLIRKQKEDSAIKIAGLRMYRDTQQKQEKDTIANSIDVYSMLGLISLGNLAILQNEFHRFGGVLLTEGHVNDSEIVFITIPNDKKNELTELLEQLYFINYGLPEEFFGEGMANMMRLGLEFTLICDQEDILESEIQKIASAVLSNLNSILNALYLYTKISEVRHSMKQVGNFALLSGWIASNKYKQFQKSMLELCGENHDITVTDTDTFKVEVDIPTKLENPKIFKPFEQLVTTFGIPNHKELDPTIIFGALYVVMYGAMFGDVGQGLILLLLGILGKIFKNKSGFNMIFGLMVWVGIASTIFGVLYGSYFGYESVYYDWVPDPLWMSPMHNIMTLLMYSIMFGVFVISLSYILGIVNTIRMKDWNGLIFSHKGVTAFIVYIIVLVIGYMLSQQISVPIILYIFLGVLSLFLGLERIWDALFFGHGSMSDWWMGFFDMFEFFLSMLTNTLSFVRIGAFALTHAALMMAVFTLRDLAGGDTLAAYIVVIIGNIFVIGMEGFIVGIQTLRLEYYEFFMRFFRGTGRVFKPINYKS